MFDSWSFFFLRSEVSPNKTQLVCYNFINEHGNISKKSEHLIQKTKTSKIEYTQHMKPFYL